MAAESLTPLAGEPYYKPAELRITFKTGAYGALVVLHELIMEDGPDFEGILLAQPKDAHANLTAEMAAKARRT